MSIRISLLPPVHINMLVAEWWRIPVTEPFSLATEHSGLDVVDRAKMGLGGWDLDNLGCYSVNNLTGGVRLGQFLDIFV